MNKRICETLEKTMKSIFDAKKRGWYKKYMQLAVVRQAFSNRIPTPGKLGEILAKLQQELGGEKRLPEDERWLTKDAEFLTKLYNLDVDDECVARLMMSAAYGDRFDKMFKKYIG